MSGATSGNSSLALPLNLPKWAVIIEHRPVHALYWLSAIV
jgi:hypothetical protein